MEKIVSLLVLLIVGAHGRVAVSEKISKNEVVPAENKTATVYVNITYINDHDSLKKALSEINEDTPRKQCSHHAVDVSDNEIGTDDNEPCPPEDKIDNGTALLLTPYIEEGRVLEARKASKVDPELFLGVSSYSGFITVNKTLNSNVFFWYFPVEKKPVNETPWIIWLQGGPGASSMGGLFNEMGPFKVNHKGGLERNHYSWLQNHSLVFIENPIGTGYSFTDHVDGYVKDMETYTAHLYSTLRQMLQVYPELRTAPLFLAGESYAGKYVPALAMEIHRKKDSEGGDVNFKGVMMGNAYMEPSMLPAVPKTFYNFGLLTQEQLDMLKPLLDAFQEDIAANRSTAAKNKWTGVVATILTLTNQQQAYNILQDELSFGFYESFLHRSEVKRALHVGDIEHTPVNLTVNLLLSPDFLSNTRPMFETLLNHYKVLVYCGQLDLMMACPVASEHYRRWEWDHSEKFRNATRKPLLYRRRNAGYYKSGGSLTEVMIRGAGHMAPQDAPGAMQRLVCRWTHALRPDTAARYDVDFIKEMIEDYAELKN